jgi:hypothetical protein
MSSSIVTHASETWVLKENIIQKLLRFERKMLRKTFGPVKSLDGLWRLINNEELDQIIRQQNIVQQIKARRIRWFGHIQRMNEHLTTRKIKPKGRPKKRWLDRTREDWKIIGVADWKKCVLDRQKWQQLIEQAKTHPGS